jgi:hypothetical protein
VSEDTAEPHITALLGALGQVEPPVPGVLEAARELLWLAVNQELLSVSPPTDTGRTRTARRDGPSEGIRHRAEPGS